jgi:hypothetical protein
VWVEEKRREESGVEDRVGPLTMVFHRDIGIAAVMWNLMLYSYFYVVVILLTSML